MLTRSKAGINKLNPKYSLTITTTIKKEPKSVIFALKDPGWCQAMQEELDALSRNKTWILVPPPVNQNILGCKWVFKTKLHSDGTLDRLKARLVAKGFHQEEGIYFVETYSPVVRTATIRTILNVAQQLEVGQSIIGCSKCISPWVSSRKSLYASISWFYESYSSIPCVSVEKGSLRIETGASCLVRQV